MRIDVYESSKHPMLFLLVPEGTAPKDITMPGELEFGAWAIRRADVDAGFDDVWQPRVLDRADLMHQVEAAGFAVIEVKLTTNHGTAYRPRPSA